MRPISITGERNHVVCFLDGGFEAGFTCFQSSGDPYCVWQEGDNVLGCTGMVSWDELLLKLVDKNPDASRWLLMKGLTLEHPKETIVALTKARVIYGNVIQVDEHTLIELSPFLGDVAEVLRLYGWDNYGMCVDRFIHQPIMV